MAELFEVDLDTLGRYVSTLREAHQQLAALPKLVSDNDTHLGDSRLNDAAEEFQRRWKHGAEQLSKLVAETTDAVDEVRQAYAGTDQSVSHAVSMLRQPMSTVVERN